MSEFNDKLDEIIRRTGAGTEAFKSNVRKRFRTVKTLTLVNTIIFLLSYLAIRNSWWPEGDAFKVLAGYILILLAMLIVISLLSLFTIWLIGHAYNKLAEYNNKKKS